MSFLKDEIRKELKQEVNYFTEKQFLDLIQSKSDRPYIFALIGTNGIGKTTSLSKIVHYLQNQTLNVAVGACDTFRSGALEQLRVHANKLKFELFEKKYGSDPSSVAYYAVEQCRKKGKKMDVLLLDTAGRTSTNHSLMSGLQKIIRVSQPDLVLFVGEAICGNALLEEMIQFHQTLIQGNCRSNGKGIDACMITKVDTIENKMGSILSLSYLTHRPILFLGTGQMYPDLEFPNPDKILDQLFS